MYLEAHIKVTKMYRKGDMRRKKCRDKDSEREINSNTVKKLLGQLHGTLPVCKSQLIKAALMTYNN